MRALVSLAECSQFRRSRQTGHVFIRCSGRLPWRTIFSRAQRAARGPCDVATALTHVNPKVAVMLLAGIMPGKDPLHLQLVLTGQRRNLHALPAAPIELPPMI